MNTYIKKLQSKGVESRKQIVAVALLTSMSLVVLVWVADLNGRFTKKETAVQASNDIKPFKLFANSIGDTYRDISASVGKISTPKENKAVEQKQIDLIPVEYTTTQ
ncbi:MAG: hypothetical protein AAB895_02770 [Patescibacteria group bacterium]